MYCSYNTCSIFLHLRASDMFTSNHVWSNLCTKWWGLRYAVAPWHPFVIGKTSVCGSTEGRMQKKAQYAKTSAAALKVVWIAASWFPPWHHAASSWFAHNFLIIMRRRLFRHVFKSWTQPIFCRLSSLNFSYLIFIFLLFVVNIEWIPCPINIQTQTFENELAMQWTCADDASFLLGTSWMSS